MVSTLGLFGWDQVNILVTDKTCSKDLATSFQTFWQGEIASVGTIKLIQNDSVDRDSPKKVLARSPLTIRESDSKGTEHQNVETSFLSTLSPNMKIVRIQRIQNAATRQSHVAKRKSLIGIHCLAPSHWARGRRHRAAVSGAGSGTERTHAS